MLIEVATIKSLMACMRRMALLRLAPPPLPRKRWSYTILQSPTRMECFSTCTMASSQFCSLMYHCRRLRLTVSDAIANVSVNNKATEKSKNPPPDPWPLPQFEPLEQRRRGAEQTSWRRLEVLVTWPCVEMKTNIQRLIVPLSSGIG